MSADKAGEIIKRAMADRSVYDAMAARENEIWGKILLDRDQSDVAIEDTKAGATLEISRDSSLLSRVANEKGLRFEQGLTLGCGAGRYERDLISRGVALRFHGIDISEKAVAKARQIAKEQNLPLTYEVADLNFVRLPEKNFDLIVAQTCLHHILFLEHVAVQIWQSLKSNGYLWIHDFIGETQLPAGWLRRLNVLSQGASVHHLSRFDRAKLSRCFNVGLRLNGRSNLMHSCVWLCRGALARLIWKMKIPRHCLKF